ncbi:MAG: hypothetical protein ABS81_03845 [Pseudonocardia sp. SCN 72-86]|uniref:DUF6611 family protein n=1 Tax=uncultured Microbacterium sp. TaxID=191216 RepID=UPI000869FBF8|nr:DUF6611 family protein [uncultured Microbacterium sp.]ODU06756.1 MAG: hypothetical protein ABS81_03845 [Pseudonocardia sp. SCN 72-86]
MVTFHNRDPRPSRPKESFRSGRIDFDRISAQTFGSATIQLLVFRPGTTATERAKVGVYCQLVVNKLWMFVAVLAVLLPPAPIRAGGIWWSLGFGAFVTAAIVTGAWLLARPTLTNAHGIRVRVRGTKSGPRFFGDMGLLEQYADRLSALESADLSPVDHEAEWARAYDDLSTTNQARSNS